MKKGFTLLELLVVIAIIGVLSAIVLASLSTSRSTGRDSARKQSLVQTRNALEIYFARNGGYPVTGGVWYTSDPAGDPGISHNSGNWIPGLVASGTISKLPSDPLGGFGFTNPPCSSSYHRAFLYNSTNGSGYKLIAHCAPEGSISTADVFYDPIRPTHALQVCAGTDCNL